MAGSRGRFVTVLAGIVAIVAAGGAAYAGTKINGADIVARSITGKQIAKRAIDGHHLRPEAVGLSRLSDRVRKALGPALDYAYASNIGGIELPPSTNGAPVPLNSAQQLQGITLNDIETEFTIATAGVYEVSFAAEGSADAPTEAGITVNGTQLPQLLIEETPIGAIQTTWSTTAILELGAGDTLQLEVTSPAGVTLAPIWVTIEGVGP